jgi:hypothetical protein
VNLRSCEKLSAPQDEAPYRGETAVDFAAAYFGPSVDARRMNAKQFAPASFAMEPLVDRAAEVAYPGAGPVQLEIRANFRRGSFQFDLAAVAGSSGSRPCRP